jgi:hypothetical protein
VELWLMGFDGFGFSTKHLEVRRFDRNAAVVCQCGRVTTDHSIREKRMCAEEEE